MLYKSLVAALALGEVFASHSTENITLSNVEDGLCSEVTLGSKDYGVDVGIMELLGNDGFTDCTCSSLGYTSPAGGKEIDNTPSGSVKVEMYTKPTAEANIIVRSGTNGNNGSGSNSYVSSSAKLVPAGSSGSAHGWVDGVLVSWMGPFVCYETTYIKTEWDLLHKQANANWVKRYLHSCEERMYTIYQTETVEVFPKIKKHMVVKKYLLDPKQYIRQTGSGSVTGGGGTSVHMLTAKNSAADVYGVPAFMTE